MNKFSIIIPTLNEADNINPLLRLIGAVNQPLGLSPEIIFVDDGSTDATRQNIDAYSGDLEVRLIRRDTPTGLAGAVVAGARAASNNHVVVMDADLSHSPQLIPILLAPLVAGNYDMVIGSRYQVGGRIADWPLVRRLGSQLASLPARLLTSGRDPLAVLFAIDRDRLSALPDHMPGFKIGLEILAGQPNRCAFWRYRSPSSTVTPGLRKCITLFSRNTCFSWVVFFLKVGDCLAYSPLSLPGMHSRSFGLFSFFTAYTP